MIKNDHNHCQIGLSNDPVARLDQLRASSPFRLQYAWLGAPKGQATLIAQDAQAMLDKYRREGNWLESPMTPQSVRYAPQLNGAINPCSD